MSPPLTADREQRVQTFDLALRRLQRLSGMVSVGGQRHGRVHREQVDRLESVPADETEGAEACPQPPRKTSPSSSSALIFFFINKYPPKVSVCLL